MSRLVIFCIVVLSSFLSFDYMQAAESPAESTATIVENIQAEAAYSALDSKEETKDSLLVQYLYDAVHVTDIGSANLYRLYPIFDAAADDIARLHIKYGVRDVSGANLSPVQRAAFLTDQEKIKQDTYSMLLDFTNKSQILKLESLTNKWDRVVDSYIDYQEG